MRKHLAHLLKVKKTSRKFDSFIHKFCICKYCEFRNGKRCECYENEGQILSFGTCESHELIQDALLQKKFHELQNGYLHLKFPWLGF